MNFWDDDGGGGVNNNDTVNLMECYNGLSFFSSRCHHSDEKMWRYLSIFDEVIQQAHKFGPMIVSIVCILLMVLYMKVIKKSFIQKYFARNKKVKAIHVFTSEILRKNNFLERCGNDYGYRETSKGYIDGWRPVEFPNLHIPLQMETSAIDTDDNDDGKIEREVYLDYAGSALPTKSQLRAIYDNCHQTILANPHSTGPAASRTLLGIQQAKQQVIQYMDAAPGRFASIQSQEASLVSTADTDHTYPVGDYHSGYDIVFTSGTTEGLRLIAENFPWQSPCKECNRRSIFLYAQNSHTSVVGMRNLVTDRDGSFICRTMEEILTMNDVEDFKEMEYKFLSCRSSSTGHSTAAGRCPCCDESSDERGDRRAKHILAFPLECNFSGDRIDQKTVQGVVAAARASGWYTLVDVAKAASTGPISLRTIDPDFCCLSFYKLFGAPTGLGALLIKRCTATNLFTSTASKTQQTQEKRQQQDQQQQQMRRYVGGGSVDIILPKLDYTVPRSEPTSLSSWTSGTVHFRGILALKHGFFELERLGGMDQIRRHVTCLSKELRRRLFDLKHGNGKPVVKIYSNSTGFSHHSGSGPGSIVTLNVLRDDGSFVGYNEVSKLAALNQPPIQFRTGCFCNPGACQLALDLTDEQVIQNYETSGHVCGDHIDVINGQPTGAIRISFGKDSIWEDLDAFVMFISKTFVNKSDEQHQNGLLLPSVPDTVQISELFIFPIKSCGAQEVTTWKIELSSGKLRYDREFALVDTSGRAMRLQNCPKMGLIQPRIDVETMMMTVSAPGCPDLILDISAPNFHSGESIVKVCGDKCGGKLWGDYEVSEWFSSYLGVECWLARFTGFENNNNNMYTTPLLRRPADVELPLPVPTTRRYGFANEQPLLLISEDSVTVLNEILKGQSQSPVKTRQFRPNIVVRSSSDGACYPRACTNFNIEDKWESLTLQEKDLRFEVKGNCARCAMVDFDPVTVTKGRTLRALAKYRRKNGQINFGIFLQAYDETKTLQGNVTISKGDELKCT